MYRTFKFIWLGHFDNRTSLKDTVCVRTGEKLLLAALNLQVMCRLCTLSLLCITFIGFDMADNQK